MGILLGSYLGAIAKLDPATELKIEESLRNSLGISPTEKTTPKRIAEGIKEKGVLANQESLDLLSSLIQNSLGHPESKAKRHDRHRNGELERG